MLSVLRIIFTYIQTYLHTYMVSITFVFVHGIFTSILLLSLLLFFFYIYISISVVWSLVIIFVLDIQQYSEQKPTHIHMLENELFCFSNQLKTCQSLGYTKHTHFTSNKLTYYTFKVQQKTKNVSFDKTHTYTHAYTCIRTVYMCVIVRISIQN